MYYPDLVLVVPAGRIAVQLYITATGRDRLEAILIGCGRKPSVAVVLVLVDSGAVGLAVQASAARLGLARQVSIQRVKFDYRAR